MNNIEQDSSSLAKNQNAELLSNLTITELQALSKDASKLIEEKREVAKATAYQKIQNIADEIGVSVEEIIEFGESKSLPKKAKAKYRNSKGDTWSGRGKIPRWLQAEIDNGKDKEDFLIKRNEPTKKVA